MALRPESRGSVGSRGSAERLPGLSRRGLAASAPLLLSPEVGHKPSSAASGTSGPRRGGLSDLNVQVSLGSRSHIGIIDYEVAERAGSSPTSPSSALKRDHSTSTICSRKWTTEAKRFLHEHRQREWLLSKAKHEYVDFSNAERAELRRYFDALAGEDKRITIEHLETMLVSLGLAANRREVRHMVSKIDADGSGGLDFEEYLEIFRGRADSEIFQVFKAMMEGRLGDPNLNFQTVISEHRRRLLIEATGARRMRSVRLPSDTGSTQQSEKVLRNFALLMRTRYEEAEARGVAAEAEAAGELLPFDASGAIPPGNLGIVWRHLASQLSLAPSRPSSAERSARALGSPPSPRAVIEGIVKGGKMRRRPHSYGGTLVIPAPALDEQKPPPSPLAARRRRMIAESLEEL